MRGEFSPLVSSVRMNMILKSLKGRITASATDENRFLIYSPEWFFAKYTKLTKTDLTASIPYIYGLTMADALAFVNKDMGWNGKLADLSFELALAAHRSKYWSLSQISKVYVFSPVTIDMLMLFQSAFGDEETSDVIDLKIRQLSYFRSQKTQETELLEVINELVKALSAVNVSVLFHNLIYSALIDRAVILKADALFLNKLILSKNGSDAVVRNYASA